MRRRFIDANKKLLWKSAPWLFRILAGRSKQEFSIGIYTGASPLSLVPNDHTSNPVLTASDVRDVPASFVADPFLCRSGGIWYMFFELLNQLTRRGEIGYATSKNGYDWDYQHVVLAEPFHLSYPHVFEWDDEFYMIPETAGARSVRLYRAINFPQKWVHVETLLDGGRFVDSSIFQFESKWWLFTEAGPKRISPLLRLYYADEPRGPWREHPSSPILDNDPDITRPAGRVVIFSGKPIRFAQRVYPTYGEEVRALQVLELTETTYREQGALPRALLGAGAESWNAAAMHHVDPHELEDGTWLACVDGAMNNTRHDFD